MAHAHARARSIVPPARRDALLSAAVEVDATEADPHSPTELGTQAASPHAMADVALGTRAGQEPRPSNGGTAGRPVATAGDALDRSDLSRMRAFHLFGVFAPLVAIVVSLLLDGDPRARIAFWCGIGLLSLCNIVLVYLTTRPALYRPRPVGILWVVSTLGILPGIVYFGPFSAVVMVPMLGIVFIAIGRVRWTARATAGASCLRLVLTGLARLHVRATATKLTKDSRLLHLLLEGLERPLETVRLGQNDFRHVTWLRLLPWRALNSRRRSP